VELRRPGGIETGVLRAPRDRDVLALGRQLEQQAQVLEIYCSSLRSGEMKRRTLENLPGWAMSLLLESPIAHLGIVDDLGAPRVLPVTYALHAGVLWSAIDNKPKRAGEPARVRWLRARPAAALTVDTYDEDWARLAWVQVLGEVEVVAAERAGAALAALGAKYPQYHGDPPPGPVLRLAPERALCWTAAPR
jgi:PPOX class probable F420-dependent enzyme